jgi:hypothetical protein
MRGNDPSTEILGAIRKATASPGEFSVKSGATDFEESLFSRFGSRTYRANVKNREWGHGMPCPHREQLIRVAPVND